MNEQREMDWVTRMSLTILVIVAIPALAFAFLSLCMIASYAMQEYRYAFPAPAQACDCSKQVQELQAALQTAQKEKAELAQTIRLGLVETDKRDSQNLKMK